MKSIMKNKELIMNILLKQKFITDQGINYKGEKDVALNEILNLIALAVQQERERIIEIVKTGKDPFMFPDTEIRFIKAINQEEV